MKTRLYVAGILGGLALLVVAVVVVFAFGRNNPSPPSLQDEPNTAIPGELLFVDSDFCFVQAAASGESRIRRACIGNYTGSGSLFWLDDDTAASISYGPSGGVLMEIDINNGSQSESGRVIETTLLEKMGRVGLGGGMVAPDGTTASTDQDGNLFLLTGGVRTKIADFDTPEYNQPQVLIWSPDSQWILLQYYPRRANGPELWIVSRDGATQGTIAKNIAYVGVAWRIEGVGTQPALP